MGSVLESLASLPERTTEPTSGPAWRRNSLQGRSLLLGPLALREALSVRAQGPQSGAGKPQESQPSALAFACSLRNRLPITYLRPRAKSPARGTALPPLTPGVHMSRGFHPGRARTSCWLLPGLLRAPPPRPVGGADTPSLHLKEVPAPMRAPPPRTRRTALWLSPSPPGLGRHRRPRAPGPAACHGAGRHGDGTLHGRCGACLPGARLH